MLKFEGFKEFDIEKLDKEPNISRDFQLIFRDDMLNEEECKIVEKALETFENYRFSICKISNFAA